MKKELKIAVFIFICIFAGFILSIIITEKINIDDIKSTYSNRSNIAGATSTVIPAPSNAAYKFQANKVTVWIISLVWSMVIPVFFLLSGLSAKIKRWAQNKGKSFFVVTALYFLIFSVINYIMNLPLDYYSGFARLHAFGLSNQTFFKWIGDSIKSMAIDTVISTLIIWIPYLLIKKSPKRWWLYTGLLSVPALAFMMFISPVVIDPVFNKYVPLKNQQLEAQIHQLLDRTTIGNCAVYGIDKSVDTNQMNAYMTGMFGSKRIVLWDTTMNNLSDREILSIVAHETGHYMLGHIWKGVVMGGLFIILCLFIIDRIAVWVLAKSNGRFGFSKLADVASLPLFILIINILMLVGQPAINAVSRYEENEADRFALELTQDNNAFNSSMIKLHMTSLSLPNPGKLYELWVYDHPTLKDRVEMGNSYKPWLQNKPLKYQEYFKK